MAQDLCAHRLVRRAGLSAEPRWGCDVSIPEAGRRQEQRRAAGGSSVLGKVVHPCREVYLVD